MNHTNALYINIGSSYTGLGKQLILLSQGLLWEVRPNCAQVLATIIDKDLFSKKNLKMYNIIYNLW